MVEKTKARKEEVYFVTQPYKLIKSGRVSKPLRSSVLSMNRNLFLQNLKPRKKGSPSKDASLSPPAAVAIVDPSTELIEIGKRGADEIVEKQLVCSKKQKTVEDTCDDGVAQPSVDIKTQKKSVKKHGSRKEKKMVFKTSVKKSAKKPVGSSSDGEEEEPVNPMTANKNAGAVAAKKKDNSSVESESADSSDEENAKNGCVAAAPALAQENIEFSNEEVPKVGDRYKRNEPRPPLPPLPCGSKLVYMGNLSPSIQESDVLNFFKDTGKVDWVEFGRVGDHFRGGYGHVRFETYEAGRKALERNGEKLIDRPVKLVASEERTIWDLITPNSEYTYLFMGNLSPSIQENDVVNFFKDDGKVEFVDLIHFLGYGHVKFASFKEALKAVQRDGEKLLDRDVELVLASETSVWYEYTPSSRKPPGFGVRRGPGYGPTL